MSWSTTSRARLRNMTNWRRGKRCGEHAAQDRQAARVARCPVPAPAFCRSPTTLCSSAWITLLVRRRAARNGRCRCLNSSSRNWPCNVRVASPDDLVFGDGAYLPRPKSDGGWFAGAVKRAKVQKITPHDLRHSCASIAMSPGVNVLALSRMLGHNSAKVTLDTYADLFDTDLDAVAEALDLKCAHSVPRARPVNAAGA